MNDDTRSKLQTQQRLTKLTFDWIAKGWGGMKSEYIEMELGINSLRMSCYLLLCCLWVFRAS